MSRASRRVSRPLIGVLAVIIALGTFFTVHKLRKTHAATVNPIAAAAPAPTPEATPAVATIVEPTTRPAVSGSSMTIAAAPTTRPTDSLSADADALVTQTPTTRPSELSSLNSSAQARAELPDLSRRSGDPAPEPSVTSAVSSASDSSAQNPIVSPDTPVQPLPDAKAAADAGDPIASRQLLNDALISGRLSESDAEAAKKQIGDINKVLVFSPRKFPKDPWGGVYQVASGERLASIAARHGLTWEFLSRVNNVTPRRLRSGQTIKIFKGPFYAVVYKRQFRMEIYLGAPSGPGSMYVTSFPVGLGRDNSTPTGLWICKAGDKIRNPRYYPPHGGDVIAADDPKNPLGGYWIAIEGLDGQAVGQESYGIHGTIDPDSIGKMESMGCIRLRAADISWVFDLLVDGRSKVLVKD